MPVVSPQFEELGNEHFTKLFEWKLEVGFNPMHLKLFSFSSQDFFPFSKIEINLRQVDDRYQTTANV